MKRTKTFVMKFLSVFILGAAVLATSCTKDLEDRMDKVEETLATVVKNVADLDAALKALPNVDGITLGSTMENGKQVLTFKVPGQADQKITIDIPVDKNDAANVTVTPNAENNTTTVGIKQPDGTIKEFTYPTSLPEGIGSVILANKPSATMQVGVRETFIIKVNAPKQITLAEGSVIITKGMLPSTRSSVFAPTEDFVVKSVTPRAGAFNEFDVVVEAAKAVATPTTYALHVKQFANSNTELVTCGYPITYPAIAAYTPVTKIMADSKELAKTGTLNNTAVLVGEEIVDNVSVAGGIAQANIRFTNDFYSGANNVTHSLTDLKVVAYEVKTVTNNGANLATDADFAPDHVLSAAVAASSVTDFDAAVTALATSAKVVAYTSTSLAANMSGAEDDIELDFPLPAFVKEKVGDHYYLVILSGKSSLDNTEFRTYGYVKVAMKNNVHKAVAANELTYTKLTYDVKKVFNYLDATGLVTPTANTMPVVVKDADGNDVTGSGTDESKVTGYITTNDNMLSYSVALNPKLKAGVYTVVITDNYDGKNSNLVITQTVTVVEPVVAFKAKPTTDDGLYTKAGEYLPARTETGAIALSYLLESYITTTVTAVPAVANSVDYKIYYRLFDGTTPLDGKTEATDLATLYPFGGTPVVIVNAGKAEVKGSLVGTSALVMQYGKVYNVTEYIVFKNGQVINRSTGLSIKYTPAGIVTGFINAANGTAYTATYELAGQLGVTGSFPVSYEPNAAIGKNFFFGNAAGANIYLTSTDQTRGYDNSIFALTTISYKILPVAYDAAIMEVTGDATPATDTYNFVQFSNSTSVVSDAKVAGLTLDVLDNGTAISTSKPFVKLKKAVTQKVEVTVVDVWGRDTKVYMNVTVSPKAI